MSVSARRWTWLVPALSIALVVVIADYVKYADARSETIRRLRVDASRTWLRDGLVGRRLFESNSPSLPGLDGEPVPIAPGAEGLLLWVVDPARCVNCLAELTVVRDLNERRADLESVVVLSGPAARKAAEGAAGAGRVALDREGRLLDALTDGRLAGVALYVDAGGFVLATEGFNDRTACAWSFTTALGALLGHFDADLTRRDRDPIVLSLAKIRASRQEDPRWTE